jgi:predicted SAM-dependent methyltransferase
VNIDVEPSRGAYYVDVINGLPFEPRTVAHIHCEHFLEHLWLEDAEQFLRECYRVLTDEGTIRIIVPDAEKYLRAYCRNDQAFFGRLTRLGNAKQPLDTPIKVVNQMFRMGGDHKFGWDFDTLSCTARRIGFSEVSRSSFGSVAGDLAIDGEDEWRQVESLYANLQK